MLSEHGGKIVFISSFILPPNNPIEIMAGKVSRDAMTQMLTVILTGSLLHDFAVDKTFLNECEVNYQIISFANNV